VTAAACYEVGREAIDQLHEPVPDVEVIRAAIDALDLQREVASRRCLIRVAETVTAALG
jgi:hypothetical protein